MSHHHAAAGLLLVCCCWCAARRATPPPAPPWEEREREAAAVAEARRGFRAKAEHFDVAQATSPHLAPSRQISPDLAATSSRPSLRASGYLALISP